VLKLSKTSWLLLTAGIFIITFASLGAVRYQQANQQNQLNEQLTLAEAKLNEFQIEQLSYQKGELEKQLSQANAQLRTAKDTLSQPTGSIATSGTLFDTAKAYGVEVTELSSSGLVSEELEGVPCSVLSLAVRVEGDVSDLIGFIAELNNDFMSGVVQSVEISIPETISEEEPSANIQLVIYTYQDD